jgi:hypothetical protein
MGSKWGQPLIGMFYDGDYTIYNFKYVTISGVVKLKSRIGNLLKDFDFVIGMAYSFNISAKQKWVVDTSGDDQLEVGPSDIRNTINRHEIGIVYGIKIPFKDRKYYLSLLFYNALTSVYSSSYPEYIDDYRNKTKMRNNSISIGFDIFF